MRILHWLIGFLIIGELISGFVMTDLAPPFKFTVYGIHKSFGVLIFSLIIIRIINRFTSQIPALPIEISIFEQKAAKIGISLLYLTMILMPVSGYLMSNYYGHNVLFFGLELPNMVSSNQSMGYIFGDIHSYTAVILLLLITGHFMLSLKHLLVDKINLFKRIS